MTETMEIETVHPPGLLHAQNQPEHLSNQMTACNSQPEHMSNQTTAYNSQAEHMSNQTTAYNIQPEHMSNQTTGYNSQLEHMSNQMTAYNSQLEHMSNQTRAYNSQPEHMSNQTRAYNSMVSLAISILQIVGGVVILLLGLGIDLSALTYQRDIPLVVIDSGSVMILLVICGGIGVGASVKQTKNLIIAHMVLCILASISVSTSMARIIQGVIYCAHQNSVFPGLDRYLMIYIGIGITQTIVYFTMLVASIKGSVLAGRVTCCCRHNQNPPDTHTHQGHMNHYNQHIVDINGQAYSNGKAYSNGQAYINGQAYPVVPGPMVAAPTLDTPLTKEQEAAF